MPSRWRLARRDLLHALALLGGQLVFQRQLCHAQNGVERRADFMAHHCDEAGRAPVPPVLPPFGDGHGCVWLFCSVTSIHTP